MSIFINLIHIFVIAPIIMYAGLNFNKENPLNKYVGIVFTMIALLIGIFNGLYISKKMYKEPTNQSDNLRDLIKNVDQYFQDLFSNDKQK